MAAPTTPATPVQLYALAEGAQFGIPKPLADLGIPTKQEVTELVEVSINGAKTQLADSDNTKITGAGTAGNPFKVTVQPVTLISAVSPNLLAVDSTGKLVVQIKDVFCE